MLAAWPAPPPGAPISGGCHETCLTDVQPGGSAGSAFPLPVPAHRLRAAAAQTAAQPFARWIGQDGHDYVGPNNRLEPSEVQDVHIALGGLDPRREITFVDVTSDQKNEQWQYNAPSFAWKMETQAGPGARTADLFLEPGPTETPHAYHLTIRYDDGSTHQIEVRGRKANRNLRMPGAVLAARWLGQEKLDHVGPGPAAGPDGLADAHMGLAGLAARLPVKAIRIDGPGALKWETGANPDLLPGAEFRADPKRPGAGDLFFQPDRDLRGQKLRVRVLYANDTFDAATVTAGRCDPQMRMPEAPLPRVTELAAQTRWAGQEGTDVTGPGNVHVHLSGLSRTPSIAAAVLTDAVHGTWIYRGSERITPTVSQGDVAGPLAIRPGAGRGALDLYFPPYRDETGSTMTLRFVGTDGRMSVVRIPGGSCDPGRCAPPPEPTRVQARAGDDLSALANQYGSVSLAEGTYRLTHPLVLNRPVTLAAEGKATLVFSQDPADAPWTAAIKIHRGQTTLRGFAVRFEGPIRWDEQVSYGPAVIGTTDSKDPNHPELRVGIVLDRLDLEIPSPADTSKWIDALRLMRLTNARSGTITGNVLRGGPIELFDGPWRIENNDFRGTPPGTISHAVFVGHHTYDLLIKGNRVKPVLPDGKTWRFLVLTHAGWGDRIEENTIEGIGSLENDRIPSSNEPEIILTEAYHLSYEGKLAGLSSDGRLMRIYKPQGQEVTTGAAVSLLSGPAAGQYRRIAQVIDAETFLVDAPIPKGTEAVSIARGFVGEQFRKNTVDIRGGRQSAGMVLVGNHFGTQVTGNHFLGGANGIRFAACPTETPVIWGWSHAPFLQGAIEDNIFEDAAGGSILGVEHSAQHVKSNKGRTYMTIALNRNTVRWSDGFLRRVTGSEARSQPPGLILGYVPCHDPAEFVVTAAGNRLDAPHGLKAPESLWIRAARYNGQNLLDRKYSLPAGASTADAGGHSRR